MLIKNMFNKKRNEKGLWFETKIIRSLLKGKEIQTCK